MYINFLNRKIKHKGKKELLAKALGVKNNYVLDASCGLGKDACLMLHLGYNVIGLERSKLIFSLLQNSYQKTMDSPSCPVWLKNNFKILNVDARLYLQQLNQEDYPDVIYYDPMFPERKNKKALSKKSIRFLQNTLEEKEDDESIIQFIIFALSKVKKRFILKRPKNSIKLLFPIHSFVGRSIRYDMYIKHDEKN